MKIQINMTDSWCDLDRFSCREELEQLLEGFDGLELMCYETDDIGSSDPRGILPMDRIIGYHSSFPACWMDFWTGDRIRYEKEFDDLQKAYAYYGGTDRQALVQTVRKEYEKAVSLKAEYMVLHVSDSQAWEEMSGRYHYSDKDVVSAMCELLNEALPADAPKPKAGSALNEALPADEPKPLLLLENLWQPGLRMTDPEITRMLLEGVRYPRKGIMLDTGHLMHTEPALRTQKEALQYIHRRLDEHGDLCRYIRGIHLHQSLTGPVMRRYSKCPPVPAAAYEERMSQLFTYVFQVDLHRPFVCEGVTELVERIAPDYLTLEFITNDLEEHRKFLKRQRAALRADKWKPTL